ncbi:MAG: hypothetical protein COB17_11355 [Sulfurimonas sp.]|nr:MAG: hypothetical protein COB17_11355 [Sulfurimonas sp.]
MTSDKLQEKVIELFKKKLNKESDFDLSYPLIPRISDSYMSNRMLVVGQKTNTWYKSNEKNDYHHFIESSIDKVFDDALTNRYDKFSKNSIEKYGGKFWEFQKKLYKENILLNDIIEDGMLSHCWINLFAMEACKNKKDDYGRPTKNENLRDHVLSLQKDLFYELLKLLQPKTIIFLTGHSLDSIVENGLGIKSGNMIKTKIIESLEVNKACKISAKEDFLFKECNIIRLYHPSYFIAHINTNKTLRSKLSSLGVEKSNAHFYTEEIMRYLNSI